MRHYIHIGPEGLWWCLGKIGIPEETYKPKRAVIIGDVHVHE